MTPTPGHAKTPSSDELIVQIANNTRIMAVKLFGSSDADEENNTGRLPKVESSARKAHERLDTLYWKVAFITGLVTAVIQFALRK